MNLILFDAAETARPLPRSDRRAAHLLGTLRRTIGDSFDAGIVNGPRGKGTLAAITATHLELTFSWSESPATSEPISLLVGLPRPQTARDILRDATTLGVAAMSFVRTEKGEASYTQSSLWTTGEWERHVRSGAEQAFSTAVPVVSHGLSLVDALRGLPPNTGRLALDNYEAGASLQNVPLQSPLVLAIGSERGWSAAERDLLRSHDFTFARLGGRILRTETAVIAALAIVRARLGLL